VKQHRKKPMHRSVLGQSLVLAIVMTGIGTTSGGAELSHAAEGIEVRALLNSDGSGHLSVGSVTQHYGTEWSWEACTAEFVACAPFGTGPDIDTDSEPANTVFRVSRGGASGLSPVWHGNLSAVRPPSVSGAIRANKRIAPIAALWSGGWDGDFDQIQLSACATKTVQHCTSLTEPTYSRRCPGEGVVLDPFFTGDLLRIADRHFGPGTIFGDPAASSPYDHTVWLADGQTSVAFAGRIRRAVGPRVASCGPPPLVMASISKKGVAAVSCGLGCHAELIGMRRQRRVRLVRELPVALHLRPRGRREKLRLSRWSLKRLGRGRAQMIVKVDGRRIVHRTIRLG
jgi:hypothetical protein